jgi:hypothetical protein
MDHSESEKGQDTASEVDQPGLGMVSQPSPYARANESDSFDVGEQQQRRPGHAPYLDIRNEGRKARHGVHLYGPA